MNTLATPNGRYGLTNNVGAKLSIAPTADPGIVIGISGMVATTSFIIPTEQAPAIALAILTAAGVTPAPYDAADSLQRALAQLEEHEGIRRNREAKAELTKRRDDLAAQLFDLPVYELHPGPFTYVDSTEVVRNAIDMIIQLQDEATK